MRSGQAMAMLAAVLAVLAGPVLAQQGQNQQMAPSRAASQPGQPYMVGEFEDWVVRCVNTGDEAQGPDPCEMGQLILNNEGDPAAEVTVTQVNQQQALAVMSVITPLEVLLPQGMAFSIDGSNPERQQFLFCAPRGCVVRLGLNQDRLNRLRQGAEASAQVTPLVRPDGSVNLSISLSGFTAAYAALSDIGAIE